MKKREEIEEKYKWDLTEYSKSSEACEKELADIQKKFPEIEKFENKLNSDENIYACLKLESEISQVLSRLYVYSSLKLKENAKNSKAVELSEKVGSVCVNFGTITSFIDVEIGELSNEKLKELENNKNYPEFRTYFKAILRHKAHMLSKKEEKLLSQMGEFTGGFSDVFDMFDNADVKFEDALDSKGVPHKLTHATYSLLVESADRELRKNAIINMNKAYGEYNNTIATNYINDVKVGTFFAKIRNYPSALSASIYAEEASEEVYKTLLEGVNNNLKVFHKYFDIKRRQLGQKTFALYDIYAKTCEDFDIKLSYEEALELVKEACKPLGEEYVSLLERAKNERWIDVYENEGKDSGAFSWGAYGVHPVVLTNYVSNCNSVFTLAHELGHCMHTYYSNKNQPYEDAGYTIFVAEVASNVNEMLMLLYLSNKAKTKEEKIYYYDYLLSMFRGSVFRQTMFSEFEYFAHDTYEKTSALSKDILNDFYLELNKRYFGKDVEILDEIKYEWSRIPHFYSSFYVYKYATGLISAMVIARNIFSGKENAKENYLKFLSLGSSLPPVELLKIAGVNLEDKHTFDEAFTFIDGILNDWNNLLEN